jgi:hypothetical protein
MLFVFIGGPYGGAVAQNLPGFPDVEPPPYVCIGDREPYEHFVRTGDDPVYVHAGQCRFIEHAGSYPHSH